MPLIILTVSLAIALTVFLLLKIKEVRTGKPVLTAGFLDAVELWSHRLTLVVSAKTKIFVKYVKLLFKRSVIISKLILLWAIDGVWDSATKFGSKAKLKQRLVKLRKQAENVLDPRSSKKK